jgi:hypothetical protein
MSPKNYNPLHIALMTLIAALAVIIGKVLVSHIPEEALVYNLSPLEFFELPLSQFYISVFFSWTALLQQYQLFTPLLAILSFTVIYSTTTVRHLPLRDKALAYSLSIGQVLLLPITVKLGQIDDKSALIILLMVLLFWLARLKMANHT